MIPLLRSLAPPFCSLILLILGSGLFNTFVSIRLELSGFPIETIGLVTSSLYVGILIGSLKSSRWIATFGHIRSFIAFAGISSLLVLLQTLWLNPWYWASLRFCGGICMAGIFVVIESWLLLAAQASFRGVILSIYLAVFYMALSAGQLFIYLSDPNGYSPFFITAGLFALSILPLTCKGTIAPKLEEAPSLNLKNFFKLSPFGFMGGIVSGMLLAVIYGLLPIYASEAGFSVDGIGTLMAILIFGGLSLQWPIGRWADKGKRRFVLNLASFLSAILAAIIALGHPTSPILFAILIWLFGGFSFTLYPLSMAYVCEKLQDEQIVPATGGFVLSYGIGAIIGPLFASYAMQHLGSVGLFYFLSLITLSLGALGVYPQRSKVMQPQEISDSSDPSERGGS